jgi:serine/threonine protein kinase
MKTSKASDIWALACAMFEIRSGFPLFESFVGSRTEVLEEMVRILGIPPKPFHAVWKQADVPFTDDERPNDSIKDRIREIGMYDQE